MLRVIKIKVIICPPSVSLCDGLLWWCCPLYFIAKFRSAKSRNKVAYTCNGRVSISVYSARSRVTVTLVHYNRGLVYQIQPCLSNCAPCYLTTIQMLNSNSFLRVCSYSIVCGKPYYGPFVEFKIPNWRSCEISVYITVDWSRGSVVSVTRLRAWRWRARIPAATGDVCLIQNIQIAWGPASLLCDGYRFHVLRIKQPENEDNHSPRSSDQVKNLWSYTSAPSISLRGVDTKDCKLHRLMAVTSHVQPR
jgi:hypothetical protein